jgi:hypothetical protein
MYLGLIKAKKYMIRTRGRCSKLYTKKKQKKLLQRSKENMPIQSICNTCKFRNIYSLNMIASEIPFP